MMKITVEKVKKSIFILFLLLSCLLTACKEDNISEPATISQLPEPKKEDELQTRTAGNTIKESVYGVSLDILQKSYIVPIKLAGTSPSYTAVYAATTPVIDSRVGAVTNATGITFDPRTSQFLITTAANSNIPNSLLQVDKGGKVLAAVTTKIGKTTIALKDIEHSQTPSNCGLPKFQSRFWAIYNRSIVEVDPLTGLCTSWATVPGAGILHGLAADDGDQVWVIQTNLANLCSAGSEAQVWRYAIQCVPFKGLTLANTICYSNKLKVVNPLGGEGGLMYTRSAHFELFYATNAATFWASDFSPTTSPAWSVTPNAKSVITTAPIGVVDITHVRIP
ncbi:MAG: hypothetical protein RLZZ628_3735 [Bacteroidota bacterium]|jgi:hypothetical protein